MHEPNIRFCLLWGYLTSAWSVGIYGRKGIELEGHIWAEPGPDLKDLGLDLLSGWQKKFQKRTCGRIFGFDTKLALGKL